MLFLGLKQCSFWPKNGIIGSKNLFNSHSNGNASVYTALHFSVIGIVWLINLALIVGVADPSFTPFGFQGFLMSFHPTGKALKIQPNVLEFHRVFNLASGMPKLAPVAEMFRNVM